MRIRTHARRATGTVAGFVLVGLLAVAAAPASASVTAADRDGGRRVQAEYFPDPGGPGRTVEVPTTTSAQRGGGTAA
ncbi:hypothetical protein ABTZ57_42970, partial [Streptomyces sp. NPDC094048]